MCSSYVLYKTFFIYIKINNLQTQYRDMKSNFPFWEIFLQRNILSFCDMKSKSRLVKFALLATEK